MDKIIINLSNNQEKIRYFKFSLGMIKYFVSNKDKLLIFHASKDGRPSLNKAFLFLYYLLGYKFDCCYPSLVKENIGFGNFIWDVFDITSFRSVMNNGSFILESFPVSSDKINNE